MFSDLMFSSDLGVKRQCSGLRGQPFHRLSSDTTFPLCEIHVLLDAGHLSRQSQHIMGTRCPSLPFFFMPRRNCVSLSHSLRNALMYYTYSTQTSNLICIGIHGRSYLSHQSASLHQGRSKLSCRFCSSAESAKVTLHKIFTCTAQRPQHSHDAEAGPSRGCVQ